MRVIRVTEVLDYFQNPKLVEWKLRVGKKEAGRISRAALKNGKRLDELVKSDTQPKKADNIEIQAAYWAFYKWMRNYTPIEIKPLKRAEKAIYGVVLSGEGDFFAREVLTDLKCAKRISKQYWLQLAAYSWLYDWTGNVAILRCDKATESYQYEVRKLLGRWWNVYQGLLLAYIYYTEEDGDDTVDFV